MNAGSNKLDPITKSRLHEEIVTQIQRRILDGGFAVGERLPAEREIAQSLKVNRATLREALKKLEVLGLIEIRHGDGIYVRNYLESGNLELFKTIIYMNEVISLDILRNILDIRKILVPEMARFAAQNRSAAELSELREVTSGAGDDSILERDLRVHHIIARASRNVFYIFILNFFNQLFRDYGFLYFDDPKNARRSEKFHADIYEAVRLRDGERAHRVMREVLVYVEERIYRYYRMKYEKHPAAGGMK